MTTSSISSAPDSPLNCPGASVGLPRYLSNAGYSTSSTRLDLPEPETPVTHTRRLSGMRTSRFLRLCSQAPRNSSQRFETASATTSPAAGSRTASALSRTGASDFAPLRYWPVSELRCARISRGVPKKTTSPPRSPAPGPRSRMRSASSMICGSCSTTTSELPASRRRFMTPMTRCMSRGCSPIEGSSSTNSVLTSEVPSAVVRLMRCTSPPESVRDWRSSVR